MAKLLPLLTLVPLSLLAHARADACGGAPIGPMSTPIAADAQRIFLAVGGGNTEIITEIAVPQSSADYGALIPLPAKPVIDPAPIAADALTDLDRQTRVTITPAPSSGGGGSSGCGCGSGDGVRAGGGVPNSVDVSEPVNVGPVTAVALSSTTAGAISRWLSDNGFAIPADRASIVDEYVGQGRWFVAIKRNDRVASGPSSIGIHFTVPGDRRALPLRFARIGAAARIVFTVFVVAAAPSGPAAPFTALTVDQLDAAAAERDYEDAVLAAVKARNGKAFVVEAVSPASIIAAGSPLARFASSGQRLTRLTTVLEADMLTADATLDAAAPDAVPTNIQLTSLWPASRAPTFAFASVFGFLLVRPLARRARKKARVCGGREA